MTDEQGDLSPRDAARLYDFSESLLRRYAAFYEQYGGRLERDTRGGRLYSHELMRLFADVKQRVRESNETVEQAMKTVTVGTELQAPEATSPALSNSEALELLRRVSERDQLVLGALERLEAHMEKLERVLTDAAKPKRPWWKWWRR